MRWTHTPYHWPEVDSPHMGSLLSDFKFLWCGPQQAVEQTYDMVIRDIMTLMWRKCNTYRATYVIHQTCCVRGRSEGQESIGLHVVSMWLRRIVWATFAFVLLYLQQIKWLVHFPAPHVAYQSATDIGYYTINLDSMAGCDLNWQCLINWNAGIVWIAGKINTLFTAAVLGLRLAALFSKLYAQEANWKGWINILNYTVG